MNEVTEIIIYSVKYKHVDEFPRFSEGVRPRLTKMPPKYFYSRSAISQYTHGAFQILFFLPMSSTLPARGFEHA